MRHRYGALELGRGTIISKNRSGTHDGEGIKGVCVFLFFVYIVIHHCIFWIVWCNRCFYAICSPRRIYAL